MVLILMHELGMYQNLKQPKMLDFQWKFRSWSPLTMAALLSFLLHLCGLFMLPESIFNFDESLKPIQSEPIELTLAAPQEPASPPLQYREVNPTVAENKPDQADAYSFKSLQAAGESGSDTNSKLPQLNGELDAKKLLHNERPILDPAQQPSLPQIVQRGAESTSSESLPMPVRPQTAARPPVPEFLKKADSVESPAGTTPVFPSDDQPAAVLDPPAKVIDLYLPDATSKAPEDLEFEAQSAETASKPQPSPRPRLAPELLAGPQMQSTGGRVRRGTLAMDASFSEFGEYEQQFYSALQAGWYQEIDFFQPIDTATRVVIQFVLQADGVIRDIEVLASNASRIASLLCQNALSKRSPFRTWTREMVETFGEERQMRVVFHYR
jgi:hypothetical protein